MTDIISKRSRNLLRDCFSNFRTLREIGEDFDAADISCDYEFQPSTSGQRRSLVEQYFHTLDFASVRDSHKLLRVFESMLFLLESRLNPDSWGGPDELAKQKRGELIRSLEQDGFRYVDGRLTSIRIGAEVEELARAGIVQDANQLREQIDRIRTSIDTDPALAIGTAKELVETTCKTVLADFGVTVDPNWDVSRLVKEARGVLHLVPEDVPDHARGADTIRRILSSLAQISQGLAELRNLYGTGHGKSGSHKGLTPRHARLAVGCSAALALFLFETLESNRLKGI